MSDLLFRPASESDLAAIVALLADDNLGSTRENASLPLDQRYSAAFEAIARDPNQLLAVAELDGKVVGCLQVTFIPGLSRTGMWRGQIESVRIAASLRGRGAGKAFFAWAIEQCRSRGCGLVQLTTDKARPEALAFYESLGFKASHEGMKLAL
ncbi:GNAT family N-acetyltransferase [Mesorhizobium sp. CGMCC 1.15528]|uniref:GNAT family N-acetyltransferase n=1 Tax=Mesorhizobium zhangyense TaxID=1776730 RepID=A0A7C9R7C2_9HYPH|nr:GNAT family N-acetyltransferase [Mesorhizobium zhangyense]NGN41940.1 GNAT family N-acetyltransferase [Mesorhizobium zhangyense]